MQAYIFGAFNPPTKAHVLMGICIRQFLSPSVPITYVPSGDAYMADWKRYSDGDRMDGKTRVRLLSEAVYPMGLSVSSIETDGNGTGKTYDTLKLLGMMDAILCLGEDNVSKIPRWYKWRELITEVGGLLILRRPGQPDTLELPEAAEVLSLVKHHEVISMGDRPYTGTSSTQVRDMYRKKDWDGIRAAVPANVYRYLEENEHVYF